MIRYWERPSLPRLVAAGAVSSLATAAKPGVALFFLVALFVAIAVSRRALIVTLVRGRLPLFVVLATAVSATYYLYGVYVRDFLSGASSGRVDPTLVSTPWFWEGWWKMISVVLAFPQRQAYLALFPLRLAIPSRHT